MQCGGLPRAEGASSKHLQCHHGGLQSRQGQRRPPALGGLEDESSHGRQHAAAASSRQVPQRCAAAKRKTSHELKECSRRGGVSKCLLLAVRCKLILDDT